MRRVDKLLSLEWFWHSTCVPYKGSEFCGRLKDCVKVNTDFRKFIFAASSSAFVLYIFVSITDFVDLVPRKLSGP